MEKNRRHWDTHTHTEVNSCQTQSPELNEAAVAQRLDKVLKAMQLQSPPSVCRAPLGLTPSSLRGQQTPLQIPPPAHPCTSHSLPLSFQGRLQADLSLVEGAGGGRGLLFLWGAQPAPFPVNTRLEAHVPPGEAHLQEPRGGAKMRRLRGREGRRGEERRWLAPALPNLISVHDWPTA